MNRYIEFELPDEAAPVAAQPPSMRYIDFELPDGMDAPQGGAMGIRTDAQLEADFDRIESRTSWESAKAFLQGMKSGIPHYYDTVIKPAFNDDEDFFSGLIGLNGSEAAGDAWNAAMAMPEIGTRDIVRLAKSAYDHLTEDPNLSREGKLAAYKKRSRDNENYFHLVRTKMAEAAAGGKHAKDIQFGADFTDPTVLIGGGTGVMSKTINKGTRWSLKAGIGAPVYAVGKGMQYIGGGTAKVAASPAKLAEKILPKGGGVAFRGAQGISMFSSAAGGLSSTLATLATTEIISKIASATGKNAAEVARVFMQPSSHARFLFRVSQDAAVSPRLRKLASRLYRMGGTKAYDVLFDGLVAGLGAGTLMAGLQAAAGFDAEAAGGAFAVGVGLGSPVGAIGGTRGAGKSKDAFNRDGSLSSRSEQGIKDYLNKKKGIADQAAMEQLRKKSPHSAVLLSTLDAATESGGMRINILTPDDLAAYLRKVGNTTITAKDAPAGWYDKGNRQILLNEEQLAEGAQQAAHTVAHEIGHDQLIQMIGTQPQTRHLILDSYRDDDNGREFYFYDENNNVIDSVKLNKEAQTFADDYAARVASTDPAQAAHIKQNASLLAEEIAAEHFASLFQDNPNVFAQFEVNYRKMLGRAANIVLSKFGLRDADGKALPSNAILKASDRNKALNNLQKNFLKERHDIVLDRAEVIETGAKIKPKKGQTDAEAFVEVYRNGVPVDAATAGSFVIKDMAQFDQLQAALTLAQSNPDNKYAGVGKGYEGQNLSKEFIDIFTQGTLNEATARQFIDLVQQAIDSRDAIVFGYRSGSKKTYTGYNPFFLRNVTLYGWQVSPAKPRMRSGRRVYPNLKVMGFNRDVVLHNVDVLVQAGFITDPKDFLAKLAAHSKATFTKTGKEGRINPLGRGENELMAAVFGKHTNDPASINDPRLKAFLEADNNGIKKSMVSYDLAAISGFANAGKDGFAFDYLHIRDNYMPTHIPTNKEVGNFMPKFSYVKAEKFGANPKEQPSPFDQRFDLSGEAAGGKFFDIDSLESITGETYDSLLISTKDGLKAQTGEAKAELPVGSPSKIGAKIKVNLVDGREGVSRFKWTDPSLQEKYPRIVSIESSQAKSMARSLPKGGKASSHVFALEIDSQAPVKMETYPKQKTNPRGRPTMHGDLTLGKPVGTMEMSGRTHFVYDKVTVNPRGKSAGNFMPAKLTKGAKEFDLKNKRTGWLLPDNSWLDARTKDHDSLLDEWANNNPSNQLAKDVKSLAKEAGMRHVRREYGIKRGAVRVVIDNGNILIEGKPSRSQMEQLEILSDNTNTAILSDDSIYYRTGVPEGQTKVLYEPARPSGNFMPRQLNGFRDPIGVDVLGKMPEKFSPAQLQSMISKTRGASELAKDSGLSEFLADKKSVTKQDVANFIEDNAPRIRVYENEAKTYESSQVLKGRSDDYKETLFELEPNAKFPAPDRTGGHFPSDQVMAHMRSTSRKVVTRMAFQDDVGFKGAVAPVRDESLDSMHIEEAQSDWHAHARSEKDDGTKVGYSTQEEAALVAAVKNQAKAERKAYGDIKGRIGAEQMQITLRDHPDFFREIQEFDPNPAETVEKIKGTMTADAIALTPAPNYFREAMFDHLGDMYNEMFNNDLPVEVYEANEARWEKIETAVNDLTNDIVTAKAAIGNDREFLALKEQGARLDAELVAKGVTDIDGFGQAPAPMKNSWHAKVLSEAIKEAVAQGKDWLTWQTGENSAKMSGLDEHFDFVQVKKTDYDQTAPYSVRAKRKDGGMEVNEHYLSKTKLAQMIGKEPAAAAIKYWEAPVRNKPDPIADIIYKRPEFQPFEATQVEVLAKGRRDFYDKAMVKEANKFAKLLGLKPATKVKLERSGSFVNEAWGIRLPEKFTVTPEEISQSLPSYMPASAPKGDSQALLGLSNRDNWLLNGFSAPKFQDYITRNGTPTFAYKTKTGVWLPVEWHHGGTVGMVTPDEGALPSGQQRIGINEAGASRKEIWTPKRQYKLHPLDEANGKTAEPRPFFLSRNPDFSQAYQTGGAKPLRIATNVSNTFNFKNGKDVKKLVKHLVRSGLTPHYKNKVHPAIVKKMAQGDWVTIENHKKQIQELGYDSFLVAEGFGGQVDVNLAVFDPANVKMIEDAKHWEGIHEGALNRTQQVSGNFEGDHLFMPKNPEGASKSATIGAAATREMTIPSLPYAQRMASQQYFKMFMNYNKNLVKAFGGRIQLDSAAGSIGGWRDSDTGFLSRETSQMLHLKYDDPEDLALYSALVGTLAPEVQDAVMEFRYDPDGSAASWVIGIHPQFADKITDLQLLEKYNLQEGFTHDTENHTITFVTDSPKQTRQVSAYYDSIASLGAVRSIEARRGEVSWRGDEDYARLLNPARIRAKYGKRTRLLKLASEARDRLSFDPKGAAQKVMARGRPSRKTKNKWEKKDKKTKKVTRRSTHDAIVIKPHVISPNKNFVIGDLSKMSERGWNQFDVANLEADAIQTQLPDGGVGEASYAKIMALRSQKSDPITTTVHPMTLHRWITKEGDFKKFFENAIAEDPAYLQSALSGLKAVLPNHALARAGQLHEVMVALHSMWGVMSISAPPVAQESGWIALVNDPTTHEMMFDSIDGNYRVTEEMWEAHVATFLRSSKDGGMISDVYNRQQLGTMASQMRAKGGLAKVGTQPFAGNSVTMNANSMHKVLKKFNGRWHEWTDVLNNPDLTGSQMRDQFFRKGFGGAYLGNKILSFVIATLARDDLVIIDRWQLINLWKDYLDQKTGGQPFRFQQDGTPVDTTNFYDNYSDFLGGTDGTAVFKTVEVALNKLIQQNEPWLKSHLEPAGVPLSIFALHWITWNMIKKEAVGHSSLDVTQQFALQNKYPNDILQRPDFIKDFTNAPKFTEEVIRTPQGRQYRKHGLNKGKPYIIE